MSAENDMFSVSRRPFCLKVLIFFGALLILLAGHPALAEEVPQAPVPGMVTVASFGAVNCVPCRMMVPIREELQQEYEGRAAIVFINLHRHYKLIDQYAIQVIPTLIFYDENGNEAKRHIGFMDKKSIEAEMARLGVK
ncbi:thioredoxin family protein [Desulfonatronum parangueonense]